MSRRIVRLEKRIEDLKGRIVPWRERAILTGEDKARRREIVHWALRGTLSLITLNFVRCLGPSLT
tara:strand:- start:56 stop:250 length:195 start_codon:yes stop_codon:yes gene_type:complete